ncbi:MAG: FprA family A-type flavoprotein [Thermoplasmata archaeon]|nr:MAG: FprA family A-type flavoprotein [Thermoplasmata archaeon]KAA0015518.1 MAG: FprA family A-type flavoprotein [Thermoplasmata archaeon]
MISKISKDLYFIGAMHWERRLFDELIPLPEGTSYNTYLIKDEKTALIDTVDPSKKDVLFSALDEIGVDNIDYVVSHHTEQDHSGAIPDILDRYRDAKVIASKLGKDLLKRHLLIPDERIIPVNDGKELSLGNRTLSFIYAPWVHWPETMLTYLKEDKILFTCDFFGSHLATSKIFADENERIYDAAKRYYAEIMMPFRSKIREHIRKIENLEIKMIAPSHGPIYREPEFIINAYKDWISDNVKNEVIIAYVSMHGSTKKAVEIFAEHLDNKNIPYRIFDLPVSDIGEIAMSLVDAGALVVATPTVLTGMHPLALYATYLVSILKPKTRYISMIVSYGWGGKVLNQAKELLANNMNAELLEPVTIKGYPDDKDIQNLKKLADEFAEKMLS